MQGLHYSKTTCLLALTTTLFFTACTNSSKNSIAVFKALDQGLINTVNVTDNNNKDIYSALDEKLHDTRTAEKAAFWQPVALQVKKLSSDMVLYIAQLKLQLQKEAGFREDDEKAVTRLFMEKGRGRELYERLQKYKNDLVNIDQGIKQDLEKAIVPTAGSFSSREYIQPLSADTFFMDIPVVAALAMLTNFQYNIKRTENNVIEYCYMHCQRARFSCGFPRISLIKGLSSSYVQAGSTIEVYAGIGTFTMGGKPEIIINNKPVQSGVEGLGIYKFKASRKPGKYNIPVEISYTDEDGLKKTMSSTLQYTVAN